MSQAGKQDKPEKTKKTGLGRLLLMAMLVLIFAVALSGAGLVGWLLHKRSAPAATNLPEASAPAPAPPRVDLSRAPVFVTLDPFTVNLVPDEGNRYLQVGMALRVVDARTASNLSGFMPEIRHRVNLILSSKLPSQVITAEDRESLAKEVQAEINSVLGSAPGADGPIHAVLFNSFIVQ